MGISKLILSLAYFIFIRNHMFTPNTKRFLFSLIKIINMQLLVLWFMLIIVSYSDELFIKFISIAPYCID